MNALLLARIQFSPAVGFYYVLPPLTIGLARIGYIHRNNPR